jgi:raffinose/stachyose/melibiose transport system substrate-binding protein
MGTKDGWETATMGYQNIGPNFYRGEEGRKALVSGRERLTDPQWVEPFRTLARWRPYLGEGFEAQTYPDSQNLFTLGLGAIYPAGSWEIADFEKQASFKLGVFKPPLKSTKDKCYISDHPDIALGVNARSPNADQAKVFLKWVASPEFAGLYSNALPGFFSLNSSPVTLKSRLARQFVSWRSECDSSIRPTYHLLSRGTPSLENEFWRTGADVIEGAISPEAAAQALQGVLQRAYRP